MKTYMHFVVFIVVLLAMPVSISLAQDGECKVTVSLSEATINFSDECGALGKITTRQASQSADNKCHVVATFTPADFNVRDVDIAFSSCGAIGGITSLQNGVEIIQSAVEDVVSKMTLTSAYEFVTDAGKSFTLPEGTVVDFLGNINGRDTYLAFVSAIGDKVQGFIDFSTGSTASQPAQTQQSGITGECVGVSPYRYFVYPANPANTYSAQTGLSVNSPFVIKNTVNTAGKDVGVKLREFPALGHGGGEQFFQNTTGQIIGPYLVLHNCDANFDIVYQYVRIGDKVGYMAEAERNNLSLPDESGKIWLFPVNQDVAPTPTISVSARFSIGDTVRVINSPASDSLSCKADHKKSAAKVFEHGITDGMQGVVIGGPVREDDHNWWQLNVASLICWAPEGNTFGTQPWLEEVQ